MECCGWNKLFGQPLTPDIAALKRYQKPPLPFVFSFFDRAGEGHATDELLCGLVVVGSAIPLLPLLVEGFVSLLATEFGSVDSELIHIACRDFQGVSQTPFRFEMMQNLMENLVIVSPDDLQANRHWGNSTLELRLLSPLKLIENGRVSQEFDFCRFARFVMRRVSSISYYYGGHELEWEFKELVKEIDVTSCIQEKYYYSAHRRHSLSGVTGSGVYEVQNDRIISLLKTGALLHVGKGASFGMGAYEMNLHAG